MRELLQRFENARPEIVFHWQDPETPAEGWVVINSLRGGAAGGGTRMRPGLDKNEVLSLAKTMEIKFTVAGPAIGGAKSGINFDPSDPRKKGVLKRWYQAIKPLLKNYYGTGGDLNVDEIHEVIPLTQELGIDHPQEGVLNGHFLPSASAKQQSIQQLQKGVLLPVHHEELTPSGSSRNTVADLITGYGVAESIRHYYDIYGGALAGKRVLIQGWGNVASAAACYLAHQGARVVGIIDRVGGLLRPEGFRLEEIKELYNARSSNYLEASELLSYEEINEKIWDAGAEVFLPAAASRLLTREQVDRLLAGGLEVMASGANVPFADQEIFYGPIASYADSQLSCIPDFISNCGMARVFAYLMKPGAEVSDQAIFQDVSEAIASALRKTHSQNPQPLEITKTAYEVALQQLV